MFLNKKYTFFLLASLVLFAIVILHDEWDKSSAANYKQHVANVQTTVLQQEQLIDSFLDTAVERLKKIYIPKGHTFNDFCRKLNLNNKDIKVFIYHKKKLVYWSDNEVTFNIDDLLSLQSRQVTFTKNGWYEYFSRNTNQYHAIVLWRIKSQYNINNKFLENNFNSNINLNNSIDLGIDKNNLTPQTFAVYNSSQQYLFSLIFPQVPVVVAGRTYIIMYFIAFALMYCFLFLIVRNLLFKEKYFAAVLVFLAGIMLRILIFIFDYPTGVHYTLLFSSQLYGSPGALRSLGDLALTTIVIAYTCMLFPLFIRSIRVLNKLSFAGIRNKIFITILLIASIAITIAIQYIINSLLLNSKISFNLNKYFELTEFSIAAFFVICLLIYCFVIIIFAIGQILDKPEITFANIFYVFISCFLACGLIFYFYYNDIFNNTYHRAPFIISNLLVIYIIYCVFDKDRYSFNRSVMIIAISALFTASCIFNYSELRENNERKTLAEKLETEHDYIAEYLFSEMQTAVANDEILPKLFYNNDSLSSTISFGATAISKRINQQYLGSYWGKYKIVTKIFDHNGIPLSDPFDSVNTLDQFEQNIRWNCDESSTAGFYYTRGVTPNKCIGILRIKSTDKSMNNAVNAGTIAFEFDLQFNRVVVGLPVLLMNEKISFNLNKEQYSVAKYSNNKLLSKSGNITFYVAYDQYRKINPGHSKDIFKTDNGVNFLFHNYGNNRAIVIAKKAEGKIISVFTMFVYLFATFFLIFSAVVITSKFLKGGYHIHFNFRKRIQVSVIVIVVLSMLLIGGLTIAYINNQYIERQDEKIVETLSTASVVIENSISIKEFNANDVHDELMTELAKFSNTLNIDFNLYNANGILVYSTQPGIYEQDLIGNTMNRTAFIDFRDQLKSNLIQNESIGSLQFVSAYEPLYDKTNEIIGFINIPFFSNLDELKLEISSVLSTLINIYVPLIALCILLTVFISDRLAQPLQLIQNHMSKMQLGKSNELIIWNRYDDEIGSLVKQFNNMVQQLARSAEMLAKSERESAWREMAKQVAHEIKNPLTPMKLSVQHLERAMHDGNPNIDTIIKRISATLTEQIDTLSTIATEFSNFAKMPSGNYSVIDLSAIVQSTVDLFKNEERITIRYTRPPKVMDIYADREQTIRVFINLLKNAIQAIPDNRNGFVDIVIVEYASEFVVAVKDNGEGISEDQKNKIFIPNFTTKTTGTGLGLAMVKSIVETANGKIWFESEPENGTTFFVQLPKHFAE